VPGDIRWEELTRGKAIKDLLGGEGAELLTVSADVDLHNWKEGFCEV
jgi:hypothetical protein